MRLLQRPGSPFWWYDFSINGKRFRDSTKRTDKSEANRVMALAYEQEMNRVQYGVKPEIGLAEAFDRTIKTVDGATKRQYEWAKKKWLGLGFECWHLPEGVMLHDITQASLDDHSDERLGEGVKNNTINAERRILKLVWNGHAKRFRANNDLEFTMLKAFTKTRFLTAAEEQALEAHLRAKEGPAYAKALDLFIFLRDTGVRVSEALNARWQDLNLNDGLFEVYRIKTDSLSTVPLTDRVVAMLNRKVNQADPFVEMSRAVRLLRVALDETCNKDQRLIAQRGKATIHTLRDTFGSNLVRKGLSLHELAKLLGHTTAAMSAKYAHLESQDVAEKARKMMQG